MMVKFTNDCSAMAALDTIRFVGVDYNGTPLTDDFTFKEGTITEMVNLREGLLHVMLATGSVYEVTVAEGTGFSVRKLTA